MLCKDKDAAQGGKQHASWIYNILCILVIFCTFGLHYVDCGHYFVDFVKNQVGKMLSGPQM